MSFILVDLADDQHDIQINGWNWRPTVALLIEAGILPTGERAETCLAQGCGGYFTKEEATRTAEFLTGLVASMKPGERVMFDGSTEISPKTMICRLQSGISRRRGIITQQATSGYGCLSTSAAALEDS